MRATVVSLLFFVFASLAQAQVASMGGGQVHEIVSCRRSLPPNDDKYYLTNVRAFLELGKIGASFSSADEGVQQMGDGASIAVLKIVDPNDMQKPQFVKTYLSMVRIAFSQYWSILCAEDKSPQVTLFLLDYLRDKVSDSDLRGQIDSARQYITDQTKDWRYTRVTMGMGYFEGRPSSLGGYEGPNGEIISTVWVDFGIIAAAKAAHEHFDQSAAEIVKQEGILDESGKVIGYRSVLTFVDKDGKKTTADVVTRGGIFTEYLSSSLPDILAFEDYEKSRDAEHAKH